jgi:hypothetical protein
MAHPDSKWDAYEETVVQSLDRFFHSISLDWWKKHPHTNSCLEEVAHEVFVVVPKDTSLFLHEVVPPRLEPITLPIHFLHTNAITSAT